MRDSLLRVGVIGAGNAAVAHTQAFTRVAGVEVAAVWGRTRARAQDLVAYYAPKAAIFDDWHDLLKADVDAVTIPAPATFRVEPATAALAAGSTCWWRSPSPSRCRMPNGWRRKPGSRVDGSRWG